MKREPPESNPPLKKTFLDTYLQPVADPETPARRRPTSCGIRLGEKFTMFPISHIYFFVGGGPKSKSKLDGGDKIICRSVITHDSKQTFFYATTRCSVFVHVTKLRPSSLTINDASSCLKTWFKLLWHFCLALLYYWSEFKIYLPGLRPHIESHIVLHNYVMIYHIYSVSYCGT